MPRVICTLTNASNSIDGIAFEPFDEGGKISEEIDEARAARLAGIPGFKLAEEKRDPAAEKAAAKKAAADKAAAEKAAADKAAADKAAADKAAADAAAAEKAAADQAADEKAAAEKAALDKQSSSAAPKKGDDKAAK